MSNSVAVCEAALPADLPNKRQVCRTVAAIDGNVGAVAGMLDQLHARMSALLRVNQDMQARMQRLERGADPATRAEIQAVRQRYATAIAGMSQVLQGLRARVKGLATSSLVPSAPAPPASTATSSSAPAAPASSSAPAAPASTATSSAAPPAPDDSTRLTLADVVDAYIYYVLLNDTRLSEYGEVARRINKKLLAATDPQERAALQKLYRAMVVTTNLEQRHNVISGMMQAFADRLLGGASGIKFGRYTVEDAKDPVKQFTVDLNVLLMAHLARHGSFDDAIPSLMELRQLLDQYSKNKLQYEQVIPGTGWLVVNQLIRDLLQFGLMREEWRVSVHMGNAIRQASSERKLGDVQQSLQDTIGDVAKVSLGQSVPVGGLRGALGSLFTRRQ